MRLKARLTNGSLFFTNAFDQDINYTTIPLEAFK